MPKQTPLEKKQLKDLNTHLQSLQTALTAAQKLEGLDDYIKVKVGKDQANFKRTKIDDGPDKVVGSFFMNIDITAKTQDIYIPLSITSGIKTSGFKYQIEGTAAGKIDEASVSVKGDGVTQITVGSLLLAKIPTTKTATFRIQATIRGRVGQSYFISITRISYKLALTEPRYQQYLKPIVSDSVKMS